MPVAGLAGSIFKRAKEKILSTFATKIFCNFYNNAYYYRKMRPSKGNFTGVLFHSIDFPRVFS